MKRTLKEEPEPDTNDSPPSERFRGAFSLVYAFLLFWLPLGRGISASVLGAAVRVYLLTICYRWYQDA